MAVGGASRNWVEQWVTRVVGFSSQYGTSSWSANNVIGAPTVYPQYGDNAQAWTPSACTANEYIEMEFQEKIYIETIKIYETYCSGGVKKVSAKCSRTEEWKVLWETDQVQHIQEARIFTPPISKQRFPSRQIKIEVDCTVASDWCEIDAVQISGRCKLIEPPPVDGLGNDLEKCVNNKDYSDVTFEIKRTVISGHKILLAARSSYFKTLFDQNKAQNKIKIQDIEVQTFLGLLKYLYTSSLRGVDCLTLVDLIRVGKRIGHKDIQSLAFYDLLDVISVSNVVDIYMAASNMCSVDLLAEVKNECLEYIGKNMKEVSKSEKFSELAQEEMLTLVQEATEFVSSK